MFGGMIARIMLFPSHFYVSYKGPVWSLVTTYQQDLAVQLGINLLYCVLNILLVCENYTI